ncbi:hypothetical protein GEMRC1_011801 [Eukaryota sp. GEM-RC1]
MQKRKPLQLSILIKLVSLLLNKSFLLNAFLELALAFLTLSLHLLSSIKSQTGSLNLEEFTALVRHLQQVNPSVSSRLFLFCCHCRLPHTSSSPYQPHEESTIFLNRDIRPSKSLCNSQWSQAIEHVSSLSNTSVSPTPSRSNSIPGTGLDDKLITLEMTAANHRASSESLFDSHFLAAGNEQQHDFWSFIKDNIHQGSEERKKVIDWMFKLAAFNDQSSVGNDELGKFLAIVNFDGIPLNSLLFSSDEPNPEDPSNPDAVPLRIREVLEEFDLTGDGRLTKDEFFRLADLVLSEFELAKTKSMKVLSKLGRYVVSRTIGFGAQAVVKLAFDPVENEYRAVKIIKKRNEAAITSVENEVKALNALNHPNIVKIFNIIESDDFVFLVLELASGGTLFDYFTTMSTDENTVRYYFRQIVDALEHCHNNNIVHRDLRMENLLVDEFGNLKMNDFGHAGFFKDSSWDLFSTTDAGSIYHLCPEQCKGLTYSGRKRDIWSLGVVLFSLLSRRRPFDSEHIPTLVNHIVNGIYSIPP